MEALFLIKCLHYELWPSSISAIIIIIILRKFIIPAAVGGATKTFRDWVLKVAAAARTILPALFEK